MVIEWTGFGWETSESQREMNTEHVTCIANFSQVHNALENKSVHFIRI